MLIDTATIFVRSGKGGDGCVSFRREKYIPKGGPDGGDGGDGGSVVLVATDGVDTLLDLTGRHHYFAEDGMPGTGKQCTGKSADDLIVKIPMGTIIFDDDTGEQIADLTRDGERLVIARGGKGGYGNMHFATATHQTPRESTPGEPAEQRTLRLELKLIADIGLIGKPNAGKSTLLSRITKAKPKIADYPFTTLKPNLGIAELKGAKQKTGLPRRLVFADIPGLIEGAHEGHGLGTQFLRHIERTRVLVHLIEIEPTDDSDPIDNYHAIRAELVNFSEMLGSKRELIVLSKIDLLGEPEDWRVAAEMIGKELKKEVIPISAATGAGLDDLLEACWEIAKRGDEDEPGWSGK